jgi:rhamnosyltransferase subunit B
MELRNRGHRVKIITTEFYRKKVEQAGIEFCPMRPDLDPTASELVGQCEDLRSGPEILFRKIILPHLRSTYDDLLAAVAGADLMLAGELVYAAPLVAEKLGLRWGSIILSPCSFFSAHDPSVLVNAPWMMNVRKAGRTPYRILLNVARVGTRHWWNPVRDLRNEEGLRKSCDPLMQDKFSPDLVLALFSSWLAAPQPDWPAQTLQPGFVSTMAPTPDGRAVRSWISSFRRAIHPWCSHSARPQSAIREASTGRVSTRCAGCRRAGF